MEDSSHGEQLGGVSRHSCRHCEGIYLSRTDTFSVKRVGREGPQCLFTYDEVEIASREDCELFTRRLAFLQQVEEYTTFRTWWPLINSPKDMVLSLEVTFGSTSTMDELLGIKFTWLYDGTSIEKFASHPQRDEDEIYTLDLEGANFIIFKFQLEDVF